MKNILLIIVTLILVVSVIQSFQITSIKNSISGKIVKTSDQSSGETYDEMMARMHPEQVRVSSQPGSQANQPTMVGGC